MKRHVCPGLPPPPPHCTGTCSTVQDISQNKNTKTCHGKDIEFLSYAPHLIAEIITALPGEVAESLLHDVVEMSEDVKGLYGFVSKGVLDYFIRMPPPGLLDLIDSDVLEARVLRGQREGGHRYVILTGEEDSEI